MPKEVVIRLAIDPLDELFQTRHADVAEATPEGVLIEEVIESRS